MYDVCVFCVWLLLLGSTCLCVALVGVVLVFGLFLIEAHVPFLMSVWQLSLSALGVLLLGFSFFRVEGSELGLVTCVLSSY